MFYIFYCSTIILSVFLMVILLEELTLFDLRNSIRTLLNL